MKTLKRRKNVLKQRASGYRLAVEGKEGACNEMDAVMTVYIIHFQE